MRTVNTVVLIQTSNMTTAEYYRIIKISDELNDNANEISINVKMDSLN